jgi:chemotaxis protein CheX
VDVRYINPFLSAVSRVFRTMIDVPIDVGAPRLKTSKEPDQGISAVIGLSGSVTGCLVINLSVASALELASGFIGEERDRVDDDVADAIGEIANMIAGNAKNDFPAGGSAISVPSVVIGKQRVAYPENTPILSIPCRTQKGDLTIDVALATQS